MTGKVEAEVDDLRDFIGEDLELWNEMGLQRRRFLCQVLQTLRKFPGIEIRIAE